MPCQGRLARDASRADVWALRSAAATRPVRVLYIPNLVDGSKFGLECTYRVLDSPFLAAQYRFGAWSTRHAHAGGRAPPQRFERRLSGRRCQAFRIATPAEKEPGLMKPSPHRS